MTEQNHLCRVWDIIEKVGDCMLTTQFAHGLRARPIEARIDRDAGLIFFVTDVHSAKHDEIDTAPNVGLVFIDPKDKAYLSITGRARVIRDVAKTGLAKDRRSVVARRAHQSRRMPLIDRTFDGGIMGRAGERCHCRLRVRQGEVDRRGAEPR